MGSIFTAKAQYIVDKSKTQAARITQASGNELRGAQSSLQRFNASLGNRKILDAAGKNITNINENIGRNLDAASVGDFSTQIRSAEELGSMAAMAAAAGVGGSSIEAYNETVRLNYEMQDERSDRAVNSDLIAASNSKGETLEGAVASMDRNIYSADLDFTQYVDPKKPSTLASVVALGIAAGAAAAGGPAGAQAAMAVLGIREGQLAADRGDMAGASQAYFGAAQNGMSAAKAYVQTGGRWGSAEAKQASDSGPVFKFKSPKLPDWQSVFFK